MTMLKFEDITKPEKLIDCPVLAIEPYNESYILVTLQYSKSVQLKILVNDLSDFLYTISVNDGINFISGWYFQYREDDYRCPMCYNDFGWEDDI